MSADEDKTLEAAQRPVVKRYTDPRYFVVGEHEVLPAYIALYHLVAIEGPERDGSYVYHVCGMREVTESATADDSQEVLS